MSNLVLIESVLKNMDAKETRSVIMLANDRLDALGESVVQPSKNQPSGKSHGGTDEDHSWTTTLRYCRCHLVTSAMQLSNDYAQDVQRLGLGVVQPRTQAYPRRW